ncbi:glycosyltransferase family 2 protein [Chloroflexota bacterium]
MTVLMTVYNGEPYLYEAVASILAQTYRDFRFLILDNASTDNSRGVIRSFNDPRIKLVELPENIGLVAALNRGLEMIDTPFVARMDADDISLPTRLEKELNELQNSPPPRLP